MCDMPQSYVWNASFIRVTCLIHGRHARIIRADAQGDGHHSFLCVTWLIHMCDMPHSYMWYDSYMAGMLESLVQTPVEMGTTCLARSDKDGAMAQVNIVTKTCHIVTNACHIWYDIFITSCETLSRTHATFDMNLSHGIVCSQQSARC